MGVDESKPTETPKEEKNEGKEGVNSEIKSGIKEGQAKRETVDPPKKRIIREETDDDIIDQLDLLEIKKKKLMKKLKGKESVNPAGVKVKENEEGKKEKEEAKKES